MEKSALKEKVKNLPKRPGVYTFKNDKGKVLYVGKAKRLRDRVMSYFSINNLEGGKTAALVKNIFDFDVIEVESEFEAIVLEAELIKLHKPKYNIQLKDDKSHLYIVIRDEELEIDNKKIKLPKILTVRETDLKNSDISYGPFPKSSVARYVVRAVRKMIPYRDCSKTKYYRYQKMGRPCFYGHIGLCSAPCVKDISITDYKNDIKKIMNLLEGKSPEAVKSIRDEMQAHSNNEEYEKAARKRDLLEKIEYATKSFHDPQSYIDDPYLLEDIIDQALTELVENIEILDSKPQRIEAYDISNISGKMATGSMVVAEKGHIEKSEYRKFKIKFLSTPDDFEMMREVLKRRFSREMGESKKSTWGKPDLILIDGGKGQVSVVLEVMDDYNLDTPVIGLAKEEETVIYKSEGRFKEVLLPRNSEGLKLLQRLRDESHRFAKNYHKSLRLKNLREQL